jgi:hypothetical protein
MFIATAIFKAVCNNCLQKIMKRIVYSFSPFLLAKEALGFPQP